MKTKLCKGCKKTLPLNSFTPSKILKDGYENKCKDCRKDQRSKNHEATCKVCNKVFTSAKKNAKYCSQECFGIDRRKRVEAHCDCCGNNFEIVESKRKKINYCSDKCRKESLSEKFSGENNPNYKRVKTKCSGCHKEIMVVPSRIKKQKYIFCSNQCYKDNIGKYIKGNLNVNYKRQIKNCTVCNKEVSRIPSAFEGGKVFCSNDCKNVFLNSLNEKRSSNARYIGECEYCGKEVIRKRSAISGRKFIFCSKECKDKHQSEYYVGERNPTYKADIPLEERIIGRNYDDYRKWRKKVYERDNYTCQCCHDDKGGNLVAHHYLNYSSNPTVRTSIDNGITLCEKCHKSFHKEFGYKNNTKEQFEIYLKNNSMLISSQD